MVGMSEDPRINALMALLRLERPLESVVRELNRISWESDTQLVTLQTNHIRSVLDRFIAGKLTSLDVENWANAIEMREDIGITTGREDLKQIICELATPEIFSEITPNLAYKLLAEIGGNREP